MRTMAKLKLGAIEDDKPVRLDDGGFQPSYRSEARIFAKYLLQSNPNGRIAIFYQNDDFGRDYLLGIKDIFAERASSLIVAEESYEGSEPTIDSHIVKLKAVGADVLINIATPKFAAQAIKKAAEIGWRPLHLVTDVSVSIGAVMKPAGLDNAEGILSANYLKGVSDSRWATDPSTKKFEEFLQKYLPSANRADTNVVYGYVASQALVEVLRACGDDLTRENVMKQAASLKEFVPDMLIPGIKLNTRQQTSHPSNSFG